MLSALSAIPRVLQPKMPVFATHSDDRKGPLCYTLRLKLPTYSHRPYEKGRQLKSIPSEPSTPPQELERLDRAGQGWGCWPRASSW